MLRKEFNPLWKWENNCVITKTGNYSKVFELHLKPIFQLSQEQYNTCNEDFQFLVDQLPEYCMIQKMDIYTEANYTPNKAISNDILSVAYNQKFYEYPYVSHKSYLIITQGVKDIEKQTSLNSLLFKNNIVAKTLLSPEVENDFFNYLDKVVMYVKDCISFSLRPLPVSEFLDVYNSYISLDFEKNKVSGDLIQEKGVFSVGNNYVNAYPLSSLSDFPRTFNNTYINKNYSTEKTNIPFSAFYPIGSGLSINHIVNQVFLKECIPDVKQRMLKKQKENQAFIGNDTANEQNAEQYNLFIEKIDKGFIPVRYHANVIVWNRSLKKLDELNKTVGNAFAKMKFNPRSSIYENATVFGSCIPGNIGTIGYKDQMVDLFSNEAASLNIYETVTKDSLSDFGIRLSDRQTGNPIFVDISDEPIRKHLTNNRNKVIFGPSGSGKSFFTNHLINNYLNQNTHCVLVDVGDSYERLCKLHKGKYFKFTKEDPLKFNPFYIHTVQPSIEKKESLLTLIFTLWKKDAGDQTKVEYVLLSDSLKKYYELVEKEQIFPKFDTYHEFMKDIFIPALKDEAEKNKEACLFDDNSFFTVLKMFYKGGEYDYLLNAEEDLDLLNQKMIVFELDNIKDSDILFPVVTLMIMDTFITKMRTLKNTRKVILIEEAWKAITKEGMANFMNYLYKTVRKFFGEAILVTQEVDDIVGNPIIKDTIIKNCGAKILLDMKEYVDDFDSIQRMLSLSNTAKNLVLSINKNKIPGQNYKEVFIGLGNEGNVYGVNLSLVEYATYTTEKLEKERIEELEDQFQDINLAIELYAEELAQKSNY